MVSQRITQATSRQARSMESLRRLAQIAFTVILCTSLFAWTVMPASSHLPSTVETGQGHAEMIETHGHSHGFEEDLYWALHGHSHDAADHDHSAAVLDRSLPASATPFVSEGWRLSRSRGGPGPVSRLERPPRE